MHLILQMHMHPILHEFVSENVVFGTVFAIFVVSWCFLFDIDCVMFEGNILPRKDSYFSSASCAAGAPIAWRTTTTSATRGTPSTTNISSVATGTPSAITTPESI